MASNDRFEPTSTSARDTGVESMSGAASSAISAAGDQISEVAGHARGMAQDQFDKLSDAIRKHPLQSAGIAAGLGFALALLARK
jgi:ElaB/YqjD/DUF883 family membrane-anchored ribosome-binding protein